ncbi:MAG: hypothetical protein KIS94_13605 [Chitinophagales bacterium]|nr:hypothetical protein [Chitinophagales bacterium]
MADYVEPCFYSVAEVLHSIAETRCNVAEVLHSIAATQCKIAEALYGIAQALRNVVEKLYGIAATLYNIAAARHGIAERLGSVAEYRPTSFLLHLFKEHFCFCDISVRRAVLVCKDIFWRFFQLLPGCQRPFVRENRQKSFQKWVDLKIAGRKFFRLIWFR